MQENQIFWAIGLDRLLLEETQTQKSIEQKTLSALESSKKLILAGSSLPVRRIQTTGFFAKGLTKQGKHEALADIYESIEELKYYRENFLKL